MGRTRLTVQRMSKQMHKRRDGVGIQNQSHTSLQYIRRLQNLVNTSDPPTDSAIEINGVEGFSLGRGTNTPASFSVKTKKNGISLSITVSRTNEKHEISIEFNWFSMVFFYFIAINLSIFFFYLF